MSKLKLDDEEWRKKLKTRIAEWSKKTPEEKLSILNTEYYRYPDIPEKQAILNQINEMEKKNVNARKTYQNN
jgi:predicted Fe-S protein YdhL (DUF1289 family)